VRTKRRGCFDRACPELVEGGERQFLVEGVFVCHCRDATCRVSTQVLSDRLRMRTALLLVKGSQARGLSTQGFDVQAEIMSSLPRALGLGPRFRYLGVG